MNPRFLTFLVLVSVAVLLSHESKAACLHCAQASEMSSATASGVYGFGCVPGFVLANDDGNGKTVVQMAVTDSDLSLDFNLTNNNCCTAPYANIGVFDACQTSDQWNLGGSHLPIQLKDLESFHFAWKFTVPYPLGAYPIQYRVYLEIFLSTTADGHTDGGNVPITVFYDNFSFNKPNGQAPLNGAQGMNYIEYGRHGQGPFTDFVFPNGTFVPDSTGTVTVPDVDVKSVLDWAVANLPDPEGGFYYSPNLYLTSASLAVEAAQFNGNVHTSFASYAIQASGNDTVFTPPFTASYWSSMGGLDAGALTEAGLSADTDSGMLDATVSQGEDADTPEAQEEGGSTTLSGATSSGGCRSAGGSTGSPLEAFLLASMVGLILFRRRLS